MAKHSTKNILGFLSFASLVIFAICKIISATNELLNLGISSGLLNTIGTIFLLITVLWSAWTFASKCKKIWRIIYIIILVAIILSYVFGLGII